MSRKRRDRGDRRVVPKITLRSCDLCVEVFSAISIAAQPRPRGRSSRIHRVRVPVVRLHVIRPNDSISGYTGRPSGRPPPPVPHSRTSILPTVRSARCLYRRIPAGRRLVTRPNAHTWSPAFSSPSRPSSCRATVFGTMLPSDGWSPTIDRRCGTERLHTRGIQPALSLRRARTTPLTECRWPLPSGSASPSPLDRVFHPR